MESKALVQKFLEKYNMGYKTIDFAENCKTFVKEMELGLSGGASSLKMIPTYISAADEDAKDETIIALDAGGTNFRVSVVKFDEEGHPHIDYFVKYPMPGTQGALDKEQFFDTMAEYVKPVLSYSKKIGFCFSYPSEIMPNKDGKLIHFNKGVDVNGVNGEMIGENLLKKLGEKGLDNDKTIVLLNDTVSTLLGGKAATPGRRFDGYIGFILGTGTNVCYVEKNTEITKTPGLEPAGTNIINVESGGYDKAPTGLFDDEFDKTTINPGKQRLEKMIAGAYQGGLFAHVIKKAHEEGILSEEFYVTGLDELTTKDINEFTMDPYGKNLLADIIANEDDRTKVYYIIDMLVQRAAKLVAINLAATILKINRGKNPCEPVCIAAEGTTFYKFDMFKSKFEYYVNKYFRDEMGIYCEIVMAENLTIIGTALSAL